MNCKKIVLLSMVIACFFSCYQHSINASSVIQEGRGVDEIVFGKTDRNFLRHYFPIPYDSLKHGEYSVAMVYPEFGASFYYLQNDDSAKIFSMSFDTAFKGKTSKGFDLHGMLVKDMIRLYGQPKWQMLESAHMLYAHYESLGIYFAVAPKNEAEPDFYAGVTEDDPIGDSLAVRKQQLYYDSAYTLTKIMEISIGVPGTSY